MFSALIKRQKRHRELIRARKWANGCVHFTSGRKFCSFCFCTWAHSFHSNIKGSRLVRGTSVKLIEDIYWT